MIFRVRLSNLSWYCQIKRSGDHVIELEVFAHKCRDDLPVFAGCLCPPSIKRQLSALKCDSSIFVHDPSSEILDGVYPHTLDGFEGCSIYLVQRVSGGGFVIVYVSGMG